MRIHSSRFRATAAITCVVLLTAVNLPAADTEPEGSKWYVKAEGGVAFVQGTEIKDFLGPVPNGHVEFNTSFHAGIGGGYRITDWLSVEAESGVTLGSIDSVTGATVVDGSFSQIPLLLNLVARYPFSCGFTPFVGAGGGGALDTFSANPIASGSAYYIDGTDTTLTYAWQVFAGIRYQLNPKMSLGAVYKYFVTGDPKWDLDIITGGTGHLELKGPETHVVAVSFTYSF